MDPHERLSALIHPSRTRIFRLLNQEELTAGEVTRITQGAQSTTSRHLKLLTESSWLVNRRVGNTIIFSVSTTLNDSDRALWQSLEQELQDRWPDDALRLATILRERHPHSRDYFGRLGARWEEIRKELYGETSLTCLAFSMLPKNLTVADLGCGSGHVLALLAMQVNKVIGIDREPAMIESALSKTSSFDNVEVRQGQLEDPPLSKGEIDIALLNLVLHLVESPAQVLKAVGQSLNENGQVLLLDMLTHDREEYRQSMGHISLGFSKDELLQLAEQAGLYLQSYQALPIDLTATGPALFIAILKPVV